MLCLGSRLLASLEALELREYPSYGIQCSQISCLRAIYLFVGLKTVLCSIALDTTIFDFIGRDLLSFTSNYSLEHKIAAMENKSSTTPGANAKADGPILKDLTIV